MDTPNRIEPPQPNPAPTRSLGRPAYVALAAVLVLLAAGLWFVTTRVGELDASDGVESNGVIATDEPRVIPVSDEQAAAASIAEAGPDPVDREMVATIDRTQLIPSSTPGAQLVATATLKQGEVAIWADPSDDEPTWNLPVPTEFGGDRHFLVIDETDEWLQIHVPVRPNESKGWIPKDAVDVSVTDYRVVIDVSDRSVVVWKADQIILDTTSAVGRANAPTPLGNFYLRDVLPWDEASVYGPYVLALSAFSETIDQINGGDAVVAIHGTSRPELIGQAVSLGCIRLSNEDITRVAETVPVGTPVEIVG